VYRRGNFEKCIVEDGSWSFTVLPTEIINWLTNCMEQSSLKIFSDFHCTQLDPSPPPPPPIIIIIIIIIMTIMTGFKSFQTVLLLQKYCMTNWL
jgi:hypothetical protein